MAFWTVIVRYIAAEKLKGMGEDVLAHGRKVFAEELAAGKTQAEAARIAAKAMSTHAVEKSKGLSQAAGKAARFAQTKAGTLARYLRDRMRRR